MQGEVIASFTGKVSLFHDRWQEFWVLCVVGVGLGVVGVPCGQALHLLTDHGVAVILPGAALGTLGTGSCKIMGPCWRLVVTTSYKESGTNSYNTWRTHIHSDRHTVQTDTQWHTVKTHRHFDCKTCWLKPSQICVFEGDVQRIDFLSVMHIIRYMCTLGG